MDSAGTLSGRYQQSHSNHLTALYGHNGALISLLCSQVEPATRALLVILNNVLFAEFGIKWRSTETRV